MLLSQSVIAQDSMRVNLPVTQIESKKKIKTVVFSTFEKKLHISLDGMHDKFGYMVSDLKRQPKSFIATEFQYNEPDDLFINKIEGRLPQSDSTAIEAQVLLIQRNRTLRSLPLYPYMIKKGQFSVAIDYLKIEPGEFYLLYVFNFLKLTTATINVNRKFRGKEFDFDGRRNSSVEKEFAKFNISFAAPQFKVYCTQE